MSNNIPRSGVILNSLYEANVKRIVPSAPTPIPYHKKRNSQPEIETDSLYCFSFSASIKFTFYTSFGSSS